MSLIEEALRRVQDPSVAGRTAPPPAAKPETPASPAHSWSGAPKSPAAPRRAGGPQTPIIMAVAAAMLVMTAVFVAGGVFWMARTRPAATPAAPPAATPRPTAISPALQPPQTSEPVEAPATPAPRPAAAAAPSAPSPSEQQNGLRLTGIVEGTGEPYAFINGQIVAVGETVGRFTLMSVHDGAAVLRHEDGTDTILRVAR